MKVDRVIYVRVDALDVRRQRDRVLIRRELAVVAAPASHQPVAAGGERRLVEGDIEKKREVAVEPCPDQAAEQASRVGADPAPAARALKRSHVQQHGQATTALPG
jgi:hypothetical protein